MGMITSFQTVKARFAGAAYGVAPNMGRRYWFQPIDGKPRLAAFTTAWADPMNPFIDAWADGVFEIETCESNTGKVYLFAARSIQ